MLKKIFLGLIVCGFSSGSFAAYLMTTPQAFYYQASKGNLAALEKLKALGRSVDSVDEQGNSPLCQAILKKDYFTYEVLKQFGASTSHPCIKRVTQKTMYEFDQGFVRPYVSLKGARSKLKMDGVVSDKSVVFKSADSDNVWGVSVSAGAKFYAFRTELEYNQTLTTAEDVQEFGSYGESIKGSQSYRSYMLNAYFDIPTQTSIYPYIGAGVGLAQVKSRLEGLGYSDSVVKIKENNLAFQLMAGLAYSINRNWDLDLGYRYVNNGKSKWDINGGQQTVRFDSVEHKITAGVRYTF